MIMNGKRGIIMGLANRFSIAHGISEELYRQGASLVFTAQTEYFKEKIAPITEALGGVGLYTLDASIDGDIEHVFEAILQEIGPIDFIVHSIAFSDKNELKGKYCNTSRKNFLNTMNTSCFSFTDVCKNAINIMPNGGSIMTLTYYASQKVFPNYNVMALAKSALETSVRYLATDLGEHGIRVNAISAGPIKTLAASGVGDFSTILAHDRSISPLCRNVSLEDIGKASAFLLGDMSSGITGEIMYVDCGCHNIGMKI